MTSTAQIGATKGAPSGVPDLRVLADALPTSTTLGRPGVDVGLGAPVVRATELLSDVVAVLDPARLTGTDAATLYRMFAAVERLSMAGKTLLAPRIDESGIWRDGGHSSAAVMLADLEGVPTGQARNTLEVGMRLPALPGTEGALRSGTLSGPKVAELSGAAVLDPENEASLLDGAADQPLRKVKERCQRARSTAERDDPRAAVRRIRAGRHFSSWTDSEGAFCYQGRDTADRGARILEQMQHTVARLRSADRSVRPDSGASAETPRPESERALRADALFLLMTGRSPLGGAAACVDDDDPGPPDEQIASRLDLEAGVPVRVTGPGDGGVGSPSRAADAVVGRGGRAVSDAVDLTSGDTCHDVIDRPPTCSLVVRVDLDALLRGDVGPGEVCEIDNQGPVPVAMARDLANDSFLRLVFHRAGDIRAVSHLGRTINRRLRTALAHRDRCCVVPGCGIPFGLEIDHVVPFASGGPTELSNLALLCHHHHYLKTYEGWTLERSGPTDEEPGWRFSPLPPFGQEPDLGLDRPPGR